MKLIQLTCLFVCLICYAGSAFGGSNQDNHANQMNPNNDAYWQSRGYDERPSDWQERSFQENSNHDYSQQELDNHSNQMNPNNDVYWQSRGYEKRTDNCNDYNSNASSRSDLNYDFEPLYDGTKEFRDLRDYIKTTSDYYKAIIFRMKTPEIMNLSTKQKIDLSKKLADLTEYTCTTLYPFETDKLIHCMASFSMKIIVGIDGVTKSKGNLYKDGNHLTVRP